MSVRSDEGTIALYPPDEATASSGEKPRPHDSAALLPETVHNEAAANAFRISLSDTIRSLKRSSEIQQQALRLIAEHFRASRVHFATISPDGSYATVEHEYAPGLLSSVGSHPVFRYGKVLQQNDANRLVVVNDLAADPRLTPEQKAVYETLQIASMARIRRFREERVARALVIADSQARNWSQAELNLLDEAGERVWAAVERAEVEEALHEANAQLREADQRKDEFRAMLSHELRNPLAAVQGAVRLLEKTQAEPQRKYYVDILQRQSSTLGRLVDDLLDVSRVTRGALKLKHDVVDLASLVVQAADSIRPTQT